MTSTWHWTKRQVRINGVDVTVWTVEVPEHSTRRDSLSEQDQEALKSEHAQDWRH